MAEQQTPEPEIFVSHPFTIYAANSPDGWFAHAYHGGGDHIATRKGTSLPGVLRSLALAIEQSVARPSTEETT